MTTDDVKKDKVSFFEQPEDFVRACYQEAKKRNDELHDINVENQLFYEGYDEILEARKRDNIVQRSALFVPELTPAINSRVARAVSKVEQEEFPVHFRPMRRDLTSDEREQVSWIRKEINQTLREIGYLSSGFQEHIMGAEIYRVPSTVKVGWENITYEEPYVHKKFRGFRDFIWELNNRFVRGEPVPDPSPTVRYRTVSEGRPFVEWLEPTRFLYEPGVSRLENSLYVLEQSWLPFHKLMAVAHEQRWDVDLIRKYHEEIEEALHGDKKSVDADVQAELGHGYDVENNTILVVEGYIKIYDDHYQPHIREIVMIGDKYIVKNERSAFRLIEWPYVPITANHMPGTIEALSSVDVAKPLQRLYNEVFNMWIDSISYRAFPPLKAPSNMSFREQPSWRLASIVYCSDPERLTPIVQNPGSGPDLPPLMTAIGTAIRMLLSSTDIHQGFQQQQYEKATVARLRFLSAGQKILPTFKDYGMALAKVAELVWKLKIQFDPQGYRYVLRGGAIVDVPALTGISDPQADKQESLLLYNTALASPFYQSPRGKLYLRNLLEEAVRAIKPYDVERFVPTEEDVKADIEALMKMQAATMEKQEVMEENAPAAMSEKTSKPEEV